MSDRLLSHIRLWRYLFLACGLAIVLFGSLFALTACGSSSEPGKNDPYARYRPALKPEFQSDLDDLGPVPLYDINVSLDPDNLELHGSAQIVVPNTSTDPWSNLVFRLYPVLEQYGGEMVIQSALVDGEPAPFVYTDDNTAIRVDLARLLLPGQEATVQLTWRLTIPSWANQSAIYVLFGRSQQMISLPLFYPSLAVYQPGPVLGSGQWWMANGGERGDVAFNVASLFAVTLTLPADWVPVTSGTLVASTLISDTVAQHTYVTGPSREFLIHASPALQAITGDTYGTRVTSYYLPGMEATGKAALKYAQQALAIYSDRFGEYPFTEMRIAPAALSFRGMEYPQAMLLGTELYGRQQDKLEMLVAHEMAHQWWYQIVHNDPVKEPWLDEALSEYSMKIYMENMRGADDGEGLVVRRWQTPLDNLIAKGQDTNVNQPVENFLSGTQYETVVYGKGALFYDQIRDRIGSRRFDRFLHNYLEKHRWQIVDTTIWLDELRDLPDPSLVTLFQEWIRLPSPQAQAAGGQPKATATPASP